MDTTAWMALIIQEVKCIGPGEGVDLGAEGEGVAGVTGEMVGLPSDPIGCKAYEERRRLKMGE